MDAINTLKLLSSQMELEHAEETSTSRTNSQSAQHEAGKPGCFTPKEERAAFVHPAQLPTGKPIMLLKTLLSSACERDCYYCPFRTRRDFRRATFKPDEFANLFIKLHHAKAAEGIFLSSGIAAGGANTQNKILDTCLQLHGGYGFMWEYPITRAYADARVQRIYAGTNEIMKEIISRGL